MPDANISAAGLKIIKLLVGRPPQAVSNLVPSAGVTRTAVIEQLDELIEAGFVERTVERLSGRGRPRNLYRATTAALALLFAGNQSLVIPAIWQAVREHGGDPLAKKVLKRVGQLMAKHYKVKITAKKPRDRLRQFVAMLTAEGVLVEIDSSKKGGLVFQKRSCPFISMFDADRGVCFIDQEMISEIVGKPVRQTACRHDGDPCCAFEIVE